MENINTFRCENSKRTVYVYTLVERITKGQYMDFH